MNAHGQLVGAEWFDEVIVRSGFQPFKSAGLVGTCGEHEYGNMTGSVGRF